MKHGQLSIFLQNNTGTLVNVLDILEKENILVNSLSIADDGDFGVLRIITDDLDKALKVLEENNFLAKKNDIGIYKMPFDNSNYTKIFNDIKDSDININYLHALHYQEAQLTVFILKTDDIDKLENLMKKYE